MHSREESLSAVEGRWDVLIVGGGITGAGIALEATRCGLRTLLVEKRDFAWGTSSRSGKLVHGGLRYLKQGKILLTRQAVRERERLLRDSGGLVEELPFLLPVYLGERPSRLVYAAGLWVYDLLASRVTHRWLDKADFLLRAPGIAHEGLEGGFLYQDARADDARLVLRVLRAAESAGATVLNYVGVQELVREGDSVVGADLRDTISGRMLKVRARAVINATGAWSDTLRARIGRTPRLRPLRGSHLVFPQWRFPLAHAVGFLHPIDRRPLYAVPWEGATLVGTTDVEQESPSGTEEARITPPELDYLMAALSARFPGLALSHADVLSTFAGVRPIVGGGNEDPSKESRDSVLWEESGLLTVTGGKLTTFHATARTAVRLVLRRLGGRGLGALRAPIAASPAATLVASGLAPEDEKRLLARFGTDAGAVVAVAREGELSRLPHLPILWAELRWAARSESVVHLDDLMLRRVRAGLLLPSGAASLLPSIRAICQTELGWDDARWEEEARRYIGLWKNNYSLPA